MSRGAHASVQPGGWAWSRLGPWPLALAAAGLVGIQLGARVFGNNDEARFPLLAQDILARGDWLRPGLGGVAYYNKPPLLAWLIALVSWPVGHVTQLTAVIPSAGAAVATVIFVYRIAAELVDDEAGRLAALVAMTTQGLFFHAHLPLPDVVMTSLITGALWMLVRVIQERPGYWWAGFYGFVAAAFWAKGPAGLLPLVVGIVCAVAGGSGRRWSLRPVPGVLLVAGAVALWGLIGVLSDRQAMTDTVLVDQIDWYRPHAASLAAMVAPLRNIAVALFPWVLLLPAAVVSAARLRRARGGADAARLLLAWLVVSATLIGLSSQQRERYYVPLVPPMAVLVGWWLSAAAAGARGRRIRLAFAAAWMVIVLVLVGGYHWELARHRAAGDFARLAGQVRGRAEAAPLVAAWGVPALPLAFYLDRPVTGVKSEEALRAVLTLEPRVIVVASPANWSRLDEAARTANVGRVLVEPRSPR